MEKIDFRVTPVSRGQWIISYTSPATGVTWEWLTNDSELIDDLKDESVFMCQKRLNSIKWSVKNYGGTAQ